MPRSTAAARSTNTASAPATNVAFVNFPDRTLDRLCRDYDQANERKKEAEVEMEALKGRILGRMPEDEADEDGKLAIETDEYKVTRVSFNRETIDKQKLIKLGVRPLLIRKATNDTPVLYPLVVNKAKAVAKAEERAEAKTGAKAADRRGRR